METTSTYSTIAIDGGGTRCRLTLTYKGQSFFVETGSSNISSNFDLACREIMAGLQRLSEASGRSLEELSTLPSFLGLAGAVGEKICSRLSKALPLEHCLIQDDRSTALRGALGASDGAIAHCGTGSFLASQIHGHPRIIGGWGAVLGDEASAQWLGRRALSLALNTADKLLAASDLTEHLLDRFEDPAGIVEFAAQASPAAFGKLAPSIAEHAEQGDTLAIELMQSGAHYLATSLEKIGWKPGLTLCLTGGLGPQYAPYLPNAMQSCLTAPQGDPLEGAKQLAQEYARQLACAGKLKEHI